MDHKYPAEASSTLSAGSAGAQPPAAPDARMVRTRAALRDALLALLEEKPFEQISIRDITARSATGYATFFRHYETKAALLSDIATAEIAALIGLALPVLWAADSRAAARTLCDHVEARHRLWSALLTGGAAGMMRSEFIRQASEIPPVEAKPDSWLPSDLGVIYGVTATVEILAWWLPRRDAYSSEQIAEILDRLVITPTLTAD
jgi:AcrR family transcriptional regulator